jgi:hypothetical protein
MRNPTGSTQAHDVAAWAGGEAAAHEGQAPRRRASPAQVPLHPLFIERSKEARQALDAGAPGAGADERLLHQLVAEEIAIACTLFEAEAQLAGRLLHLLDDPKLLLAVSKVLRDVVLVRNSVTRRIEGALGVASNLRAQRQFLARQGQKKGSSDGI